MQYTIGTMSGMIKICFLIFQLTIKLLFDLLYYIRCGCCLLFKACRRVIRQNRNLSVYSYRKFGDKNQLTSRKIHFFFAPTKTSFALGPRKTSADTVSLKYGQFQNAIFKSHSRQLHSNFITMYGIREHSQKYSKRIYGNENI